MDKEPYDNNTEQADQSRESILTDWFGTSKKHRGASAVTLG